MFFMRGQGSSFPKRKRGFDIWIKSADVLKSCWKGDALTFDIYSKVWVNVPTTGVSLSSICITSLPIF